ncbi:hypothetical protein [Pseudoalteromonas piscicida]|uniref:hypothetical protein n=1 Tax=Pseudoalteromonas piscicida TaxID=43662 RepID=UPI001F5BD5C3|nr:hypothetical protein [Pseudoalteromonas piscicida]
MMLSLLDTLPHHWQHLPAKTQDRFGVLSNYPSVVRIVDLEYQFADSSIAPRCHFRLVVMKDYRSGKIGAAKSDC